MLDEIRQNGKTVLSGEDGFSIPMFFNNLCGKNFSGEKYRDYIRYIAFGEMGFKPYLDPSVQAVVKVGDTVSDIWEGRNAGVCSLGVLEGSRACSRAAV